MSGDMRPLKPDELTELKPKLLFSTQDDEVCRHCPHYFECYFPTTDCPTWKMLKNFVENNGGKTNGEKKEQSGTKD